MKLWNIFDPRHPNNTVLGALRRREPGIVNWYFKGETFTDEIGSFTAPVMKSGWYMIINHYGHVTVEAFPGGFWWGLRQYRIRR